MLICGTISHCSNGPRTRSCCCATGVSAPLPTRSIIDGYGGIAEWYRVRTLEAEPRWERPRPESSG